MHRIIVLLLTVLLVLSIGCALAEDTTPTSVTVQVNLKYRYDLAQTMLPLINAFRTDPTSWYWTKPEEGKPSVQQFVSGLSNLTYDYGLEKAAMERAAEIAVNYSHTRPNGTAWSTKYPAVQGGVRGENFLCGPITAEKTFIAWREDDKDYSGQSHRRNMLDARFTHAGVGCAQVNSVVKQADGTTKTTAHLFWVLALTTYATNEPQLQLTGSYQLVPASVEILKSIGFSEITPVPTSLRLTVASEVRTPYLSAQTKSTGTSIFFVLDPAWVADDETLLKIAKNKITPMKAGRTILTVSNLTDTPLTVDVVVPCTEHTFDAGVPSKPATCSQEGVMLYTCTVCGDTKTDKIEKLPHTLVKDPFMAPTESASGLTEGEHCSVCLEVTVPQLRIPAFTENGVLRLPKGMTVIEDQAFIGVSASVVVIPDSCKTIGSMAFANCGNLLYVRMPAGTNFAEDSFSGTPSIMVIEQK